MSDKQLYGVLGEFEAPEALVAAAQRVRAAGFRRVDAFSPYPVDGLAQALGFRWTWLPLATLVGGLLGGAGGYGLQYWVSVIQYPLNVGGRPLHSWPAFIPITFELAIVGAGLGAVLGMLALNGLPQPHHPVFNVPEFARATQDRFYLLVRANDEQFDYERTRLLLLGLGARQVSDVEQ